MDALYDILDWSTLKEAVAGDPFWEHYLLALDGVVPSPFSIHLAVMVEPFLMYVLDGSKTIEARFSDRLIPPHGSVRGGDVILLKSSGGPITGICRVAEVWFYTLSPSAWQTIRQRFTVAAAMHDTTFLEERRDATYATFMHVDNVKRVDGVRCTKRDRRGWVILWPASEQMRLF